MKLLIAITVVLALLAFVQAQDESTENDVVDVEESSSDAEEESSSDAEEESSPDPEEPASEEPRPPKPEGPRPGRPGRHHGHRHPRLTHPHPGVPIDDDDHEHRSPRGYPPQRPGFRRFGFDG